MATACDLLSTKSSAIYCIDADASVLQATILMNDHRIGGLVVIDAGRLCGIFTERDVLTRVVAPELAPAKVKVRQVMTEKVVCVGPDADLDDIRAIMMNRKIRHLPIADEDGRLVGMISIGDINAYDIRDNEARVQQLNEYIYGRV